MGTSRDRVHCFGDGSFTLREVAQHRQLSRSSTFPMLPLERQSHCTKGSKILNLSFASVESQTFWTPFSSAVRQQASYAVSGDFASATSVKVTKPLCAGGMPVFDRQDHESSCPSEKRVLTLRISADHVVTERGLHLTRGALRQLWEPFNVGDHVHMRRRGGVTLLPFLANSLQPSHQLQVPVRGKKHFATDRSCGLGTVTRTVARTAVGNIILPTPKEVRDCACLENRSERVQARGAEGCAELFQDGAC